MPQHEQLRLVNWRLKILQEAAAVLRAVLRGAARCCAVLRGAARCCAVLRGAARCCAVLRGAAQLRAASPLFVVAMASVAKRV